MNDDARNKFHVELNLIHKDLQAIRNQLESIAKNAKPEDSARNPEPQKVVIPEFGLPAAIRHYYETEQQDEIPKRRRRRRELVIAILGLIVLAAYTGVTWSTFNEIKTQTPAVRISADAAQKQLAFIERPWLSIDAYISGPLVLDQAGIHFAVTYVLKNVGHSPAQDVMINGRFVELPNRTDIRSVQDKACKDTNQDAIRSKGLQWGSIIFPGDDHKSSWGYGLTTKELKDGWNSFGGPQPPNSPRTMLVFPTILGCVDYTFTFAEGHHQTGFIFDLKQKDMSLPIFERLPLEPNQLILTTDIYGGHYAN